LRGRTVEAQTLDASIKPEEGHDFEDPVPERDLMGIIKLIVEQSRQLVLHESKKGKMKINEK
jgi:hypothetical protein